MPVFASTPLLLPPWAFIYSRWWSQVTNLSKSRTAVANLTAKFVRSNQWQKKFFSLQPKPKPSLDFWSPYCPQCPSCNGTIMLPIVGMWQALLMLWMVWVLAVRKSLTALWQLNAGSPHMTFGHCGVLYYTPVVTSYDGFMGVAPGMQETLQHLFPNTVLCCENIVDNFVNTCPVSIIFCERWPPVMAFTLWHLSALELLVWVSPSTQDLDGSHITYVFLIP